MSTRRAFAFSFADRYLGLAVHMVSAMIIARLLSPGDIGIYSLTMVLVTFIATFRDLGAGQYLVQKSELSTDDVRATWAVQLSLGILFALVIASICLPVAWFYDEPRMTSILLVLSANFVITPFQALPYAWLARAMRFDALAAMRVTAALVQAAVGIALAFEGVGPISLAWANLAATAAGVVIAVAMVGSQLPWTPRFAGVKDVVSFGGRFTAISLLNTIRSATPELFLGKLQGMHDTGLFSRGQGLVALFERLVMDAVNAVALPLFSKEIREGRDISASFLRAAALITAVGWSFLSSLAILAFPVVRVLYGTQWDESVDPTRWLAAAMAVAVPVYLCLAPMLAVGAVRELLRVAALSTCVAVIFSGAGASFGLLTTSQLMLPAAAISSALWLCAAKRHLSCRWSVLFRTFAKSALLAGAASVAPLAVSLVFGWRSSEIVTTLLIGVPGGLALFCAAAFAVRHPIWEELRRAVSHVLRRR